MRGGGRVFSVWRDQSAADLASQRDGGEGRGSFNMPRVRRAGCMKWIV